MAEMTREQIIEAFANAYDDLIAAIEKHEPMIHGDMSRTGYAKEIGHVKLANGMMEVQIGITGDKSEWIDRSFVALHDPQYVLDNEEFFTDRQVRRAKMKL